MDWMRSANVNVIVVRSCLFRHVLLLPSVIISIDFDSFPDGSTGSLRNDDVLYGMPENFHLNLYLTCVKGKLNLCLMVLLVLFLCNYQVMVDCSQLQ